MDIFESWLAKKPIAHRGLHTEELPENSLGAFEHAISKGFPIELDVKELDDGTVVVFHDDTLCRMTGQDGYLSKLKSECLKDYKLLKTDYSIPTLKEVLELVNGQVPLLIEIKNDNKAGILEKNTLDILKTYNGDFAVQSFNPYSLEYFKLNAPNIIRGQLSCFFKKTKQMSLRKWMLKRMMFNKKLSCPHFISYQYQNLPNRYVDKYSDLPVIAWTLTSNLEAQNILKYCNNIIFEAFEPRLEKELEQTT